MASIDLGDLQAFAAVAEARSFRRAALLRNVSASALSEAVRRLETRTGVRLLNRTTRSVTPTEAGTLLLGRLGPALGEVAAALDALNGLRDSPSGTLKLDVPGIVARAVLPSILERFLATHPGIDVDVNSNDAFVDVLAAGYDAGVRYDERLERDMIAVPLGPREQRFVVAAAPAYIERHGAPQHPTELARHACVRHRFSTGIMPPWIFERDGQTIRTDPPARVVTTSVELQVEAAIRGLGVICTFEDFMAPALASGTLRLVMPDWIQTFSGPFLYYPSRRQMPAPLKAFVDFLKSDGGLGNRP